MSKAMIVSVWWIAACATGGGDSANVPADAALIRQDASAVTSPDASIRLDGGVTPAPDAQVSQTVDAGSSLFCSTHSACTVSGECCVTLGGPQGFCAPGTVVFGQCFPE